MAYTRKTRDTYEVQGLWYGQWELETCEDSRAEARERLKEYRANQPEVPHRIKTVREPIEA